MRPAHARRRRRRVVKLKRNGPLDVWGCVTKTSLALLALHLSVAGPLVACGAPCAEIARDRAAFLARPATHTASPHVQLVIPFAAADHEIARRIGAVPPARVTLPGLNKLGLAGDRLELRLRSATLAAAPAGKAGVALSFALSDRRETWLTFDVDAHVAPRLERGSGVSVVVEVRPQDLRSVRPRLGPGARDRLVQLLRRELPSDVRRVLPASVLVRAAEELASYALDHLFGWVRDNLLDDVGAVTRLAYRLPDLPIATVSARTDPQKALVVTANLALPVSAGLGRHPIPTRLGHAVELRVAGAAMAELVNWAMARGEVPARMDAKGRPTADGPYLAGLGWERGERPLKVTLWREDGDCMRVVVGGTPQLSMRGGQLEVRVADGRIESVRGSALTEFGAWIQSLWADAIRVTRRFEFGSVLDIGGTKLGLSARSARLVGDDLLLTLTLSSR